MNGPGFAMAWSTVMPMLVSKFSKATFLGRNMVATKSELLNAVTRPVACSSTSHLQEKFSANLDRALSRALKAIH